MLLGLLLILKHSPKMFKLSASKTCEIICKSSNILMLLKWVVHVQFISLQKLVLITPDPFLMFLFMIYFIHVATTENLQLPKTIQFIVDKTCKFDFLSRNAFLTTFRGKHSQKFKETNFDSLKLNNQKQIELKKMNNLWIKTKMKKKFACKTKKMKKISFCWLK